MSKTFIKLLCIVLTVTMLLAVCSACKQDTPTTDLSNWEEEEIIEYEEDPTSGDSGSSQDGSSQDGSSQGGSSQGGSSQGGSSQGGTQTGSSTASEKFLDSMPKKLRGTTLTYFYWWDPKTQMEKDAIKEFEKKTGITVKTEVGSYSNFTTELTSKIAAGNSPDIVRLLSNAMYQVKALQPITNSGYNFSDDIWWKKLMSDYTYNGKTYAVNVRPKNAAVLDTTVIYYNKRALKAAGLQDPYQLWKKNPKSWTMDKFWSMCEEFVKANNSKAGYYGVSFQYNNAYVRMFGCANYDYNSKTGKWENYMSSTELAKRWSELITYNRKGLSSVNHDASSFEKGKILFDVAGPFAARQGDQTHQSLKNRKELGVVPLPTDAPYQVLYEYTAFGIPQGAKNAAAVPYYLRYVLDEENYNLDKVYIDSQTKEVVEYSLSFADNKYFFGENENASVRAELVDSSPDQVASVLKKYEGVIQSIVDSSNEQINYLSK